MEWARFESPFSVWEDCISIDEKKKTGNEEKFAEGECAKVWRKSDVPFRWSWQLRTRGKDGTDAKKKNNVVERSVRDSPSDNDIVNVLFFAWEKENYIYISFIYYYRTVWK